MRAQGLGFGILGFWVLGFGVWGFGIPGFRVSDFRVSEFWGIGVLPPFQHHQQLSGGEGHEEGGEVGVAGGGDLPRPSLVIGTLPALVYEHLGYSIP